MAYFQTKNPNLGKFLGQWKILRPFGVFYVHLVYFMAIWYLVWCFNILFPVLVRPRLLVPCCTWRGGTGCGRSGLYDADRTGSWPSAGGRRRTSSREKVLIRPAAARPENNGPAKQMRVEHRQRAHVQAGRTDVFPEKVSQQPLDTSYSAHKNIRRECQQSQVQIDWTAVGISGKKCVDSLSTKVSFRAQKMESL
jgi:hypothetical protein